MEVPTSVWGLLWALPISLSIAVIYKAVKLESLETRFFIREVILLFATIIGFLILAAVCLLIIAKLTIMK